MSQVAKIVRSKNSGPFEMTFDIMFDDEETYERVKSANLLTNDTVKKLYRVKDEDILANIYFRPALAWKCTIKRPYAQGSVGELDTLGTQQHAPLLDIIVPAAHKKLPNGFSKINDYELNGSHQPLDRSEMSPFDAVSQFWSHLELPKEAVNSLELTGTGIVLPSSFKIAHLAQSSIALSALTAALVHSLRNSSQIPRVAVPLRHAAVEFKSERLYVLDGKPTPSPWGPIGGLHKTSDGYVRVHDSFPNHREGALSLVGCESGATREDLAAAVASWTAIDLEQEAVANKLAITALRSYSQWDSLPAARCLPDFPITIKQIRAGPPSLSKRLDAGRTRALHGLRVLELSRVIAAPLAGKTLAAHGADVLWVTSPNLPDLPTMDRDFARGKRTTHLDLNSEPDLLTLRHLASEADVFIQGYSPGSMSARGLGPKELADLKKDEGIVYASMSAFGFDGPWGGRRGFDSLVQTCSGMNISEAEHYGEGEAARPTPCQALDHAGGYFLAAGINAALYKQATIGGSWEVQVSLAGTMKYFRSFGQYPGKEGFAVEDINSPDQVPEYLETKPSGFGPLQAIRHSASIEGAMPFWERMPKPLGSDPPEWL